MSRILPPEEVDAIEKRVHPPVEEAYGMLHRDPPDLRVGDVDALIATVRALRSDLVRVVSVQQEVRQLESDMACQNEMAHEIGRLRGMLAGLGGWMTAENLKEIAGRECRIIEGALERVRLPDGTFEVREAPMMMLSPAERDELVAWARVGLAFAEASMNRNIPNALKLSSYAVPGADAFVRIEVARAFADSTKGIQGYLPGDMNVAVLGDNFAKAVERVVAGAR